jgi:hypothetical protein
MMKWFFCAYAPDTFRFIQWRPLSDTVPKCFISTSVFPEIGMQKNLSILNRCWTLFQSVAFIDFAVFLLITTSSWNECFKITSSRSSSQFILLTYCSLSEHTIAFSLHSWQEIIWCNKFADRKKLSLVVEQMVSLKFSFENKRYESLSFSTSNRPFLCMIPICIFNYYRYLGPRPFLSEETLIKAH